MAWAQRDDARDRLEIVRGRCQSALVSDSPTLNQRLRNPEEYGIGDDEFAQLQAQRDERDLGQAAQLLHKRGQDHAAALMLDVESIDYNRQTIGWDAEGWTPTYRIVAVLDVETFLLPRFTDERIAEIADALDTVRDHYGEGVDAVRIREVLPVVGKDWREQLARDLAAERPNNQGQRVRLDPARQVRDGLYLTNIEEEKVYAVLREVQASLPDNETFLIAPLPGVFVPPDHTWYPDFLITYGGRAGVIEVDGPHHRREGRRAADVSRDHLLENAGVRRVARIVVEDVTQKYEVEKFIRDFLKRLTAA